MQDDLWQHKDGFEVRLIRLNGDILQGKIFCAAYERVSDVITNAKNFLPFEGEDGRFHVIPKATLARVIPLDNGKPVKMETQLDQIAVEITTIDEQTMVGKVVVFENQRVVDVLNSDRSFIPIETERGEVEIINKSTIDLVTPIEMRKAA